jgi:hypothetical protein
MPFLVEAMAEMAAITIRVAILVTVVEAAVAMMCLYKIKLES